MKHKFYLTILVVITIKFIGVVTTLAAIRLSNAELQKAWNKGQWIGKNEDGSVITKWDIEKMLENHKKWLETNGAAGEQIKLEKADLSKAWLPKADLRRAVIVDCDFTDADLWSANLNNALLSKTIFKGAYLSNATFQNAYLSQNNFTNANFLYSKFNGAELSKNDFTNAFCFLSKFNGAKISENNFTSARLKDSELVNADLSGTRLDGADLGGADLREVIFNPVTLPSINSIQTAYNLSTLRYLKSPDKLMELRKKFKDAGLRRLEREITYAIKHTQRLKLLSKEGSIWNKLEGLFFLIFYEWTCAYGMKPGRPLIILFFWIIPIFSICYSVLLKWPAKTDGIWKVWVSERVRKDLGSKEPERLKLKFFPAIVFGFYFSIISAFSIGWRDLNVGNWITRVQPREYTLQASGWARTVSGVQSLISVYLLALWVLTYFGRPFDNV